MTVFWWFMRPFWTPIRKRMCIRMPRLKKWKTAFTINSQKKIKKVAFRWPSSWKLNFKSTCLIKIRQFFSEFCYHIEPLFWWECAYICHDLKNEKEGIYVKKVRIYMNQLPSKRPCTWKYSFKCTFLANSDHFLSSWFVHFEPFLEWEVGYVCNDLRIEKGDI